MRILRITGKTARQVKLNCAKRSAVKCAVVANLIEKPNQFGKTKKKHTKRNKNE